MDDDMRAASRRRLMAITSIAAVFVGACSTDESEPSYSADIVAGPLDSVASPSSGTSIAYMPEDQPIYRILYDRLGIHSGDLRASANRARLHAYLDCMTERGFDMPSDGAVPIVRLPASSYSPVDDGISQIRALEAMASVQIPEEQMGACLIAIDSINPFNDLFSLVEAQTSAVSDRVRTDDRYVAAREQLSSCPADTPPSDGRQSISEQVGAVMNSYTVGTLDAAGAFFALEQLRGAANQIDWSIDGGCDESFMGVERQLVSEYQQEFLDDNPGFIDGLVEKFQQVVDQYVTG